MTIVLHIGVSKTGSSAIQYGLAQHQETLEARGLHYALDGAETLVERRLIASGNGGELARQLNPRPDAPLELTSAQFDREFVSDTCPISLISCESLSEARPDLLARFRDEVIGAREVRVVAFVRDLYGHAVSSWMQRIKRHGYIGLFQHFCAKSYSNKQCSALRTYAEAFGPERMSVIHYGGLQESPFKALLRTLGVPAGDLPDPPRINRRLSAAEVEVLIACNALHKNRGELSARISDHLIYKHPDRPTDSVRSAAAARTLAERFGDDVDWVNRTFFPAGRGLAIGQGAPGPPATAEDRQAVWTDAVEVLGGRLVAVEVQNRKLRAEIEGFKLDRVQLRAELAQVKDRSLLEHLKFNLARRFRRRV